MKKISKVIIVTIFEDGTSEFQETVVNYPKFSSDSEVKAQKIEEGHCPECRINISAVQESGCQALYCPSGFSKIIS